MRIGLTHEIVKGIPSLAGSIVWGVISLLMCTLITIISIKDGTPKSNIIAMIIVCVVGNLGIFICILSNEITKRRLKREIAKEEVDDHGGN